MTQPFLSIAIPTFNRAQRLDQCLSMVADRIAELPADHFGIEVLVVDNASTDETRAVVAKQQGRFREFRYVRNDHNLGIDGNIHRCSQLAKGRWVQLLSDDDLMVPGALTTIMDRLRKYNDADFLFLNVISFTEELPPPGAYRTRLPIKDDVVCTDCNFLVETCHIWLTFLTSFVFRREAWCRSPTLESYIGTDIYLSYALFDLLSKTKKTVILAQPLVAARAHFSGSYRIFYAFGYQWTELLLRHAPSIGFDPSRMRSVLQHTVRHDLLARVIRYRVEGEKLSTEERANVFHSVKHPSWSGLMLWFAIATPEILVNSAAITLRWAKSTLRFVQRYTRRI